MGFFSHHGSEAEIADHRA